MRQAIRLIGLVLAVICIVHQMLGNIKCQSILASSVPENQDVPAVLKEIVNVTLPTHDNMFPPQSSSSLSANENKNHKIDLKELMSTQEESSCPPKLVLMHDRILSTADNLLDSLANNTATIPRYIHVTGKSRCVTESFATNLEKWKTQFRNYSFFYHNDAAMERLLYKNWPEFPHLQQALHCTVSGAARADLWRALVLWEYGGIYTDIDNAPGPLFNVSTLRAEDQAFFLVENEGFLSQYFMAARPRHPLFFYLVHSTVHRLMDLHDVENQYVPYVTGPGALKTAFLHYMQAQGHKLPSAKKNKLNKPSMQEKYDAYHLVRAGTYTGYRNNFGRGDDHAATTTIRVEGSRRTSDRDWVRRNVIPRKKLVYRSMNMTHFGSIPRRVSNISCWQRIFERNRYS